MLRGSSSTDDFHSVLTPLSLNTALSRGQRLSKVSATPKRQVRQTIGSSSGSSTSHRRTRTSTPSLLRTRSCTRNEWLEAAQASPWTSRFYSSPLATPSRSRTRRDSVSYSTISRATSNLHINTQVQNWTRQQSRLARSSSTFQPSEEDQQENNAERDYQHDGAECIL